MTSECRAKLGRCQLIGRAVPPVGSMGTGSITVGVVVGLSLALIVWVVSGVDEER